MRLPAAMALALAALCAAGCASARNNPAGSIRIYALKYGESAYRANLVNTLSSDRLVRFNWLFYLVESGSPPHYTLIDTGFESAKLRSQFRLRNFRTAADLLSLAGVKSGEISRVILTHSHFDHAESVVQFKNSEFVMQREEFRSLSDKSIAAFLKSRQTAGKLQLIDAPRQSVGEFELVFTGGHTPGSQAIRLEAGGKAYLFTGDECYFQDACRARVSLPAASAHSQKNNADFLRTISDREIILTGHETNLTGGRWLNDFVYLIEP